MTNEFFFYSLIPRGGMTVTTGWKNYAWDQMAGVFINLNTHGLDLIAIYGRMEDFIEVLDQACMFDLPERIKYFSIPPDVMLFFKMVQTDGYIVYGFTSRTEIDKLVDTKVFRITKK